jgi:hypothetical protein
MKAMLQKLAAAGWKLAALLIAAAVTLPPDAARAQALDFGDAPSPYPTLLNVNGARHNVALGVRMGARFDTEADGQPNATATGDDINPTTSDDEDGVLFLTLLVPGLTADVQINVSVSGVINAWFDFNGDGDWADAGEQVFVNMALPPGNSIRTFTVPATATLGTNHFARFRFTTNVIAGLSFTGQVNNGEVEDYQVPIVGGQDFGDAPDPSYPTVLVANGARHRLGSGIFLGARVDGEANGQPDAAATGDDLNPATADDEDGVTFTGPLVIGQPVSVQVVASLSALLDAWVDFNGNGTWGDPGEQIFTSQAVSAGANLLTFVVPASATAGGTFARYRLSRFGGLSFVGEAGDGEVEDYRVTLVEALDFGDAPDPSFPTVLVSNGARHQIVQGVHLGQRVDVEPDGQPNATATGDDILPSGAPSDEDGVTFLSALVPGQAATIRVVASVPGVLNAWLDFDGNGVWTVPGEQIFTEVTLTGGSNTLTIFVPCAARSGAAFARFRFSRTAGLSFTGLAPDGEVEDYRVTIADDPPPQITCPNDITVRATSPDGAVVNFSAMATDPCDPAVMVTCTPPSGSTFPVGMTTVSCTAVDSKNQIATCTFKITVLPPLCCDGKQWVETSQRTSPSPRQGHAMASDTGRDRVVLFGGSDANSYLQDTWEWDGAAWMPMATFGPSPRDRTAMAYDSARGVTVLFGGAGVEGPLGDTWEWDGALWRPVGVSGPSPRLSHAMAYDPARGRIVLYGGFANPGGALSDTWEYDGMTWVQVAAGETNPGRRFGHGMAWDGMQVVLYGGAGPNGALGDTWKWDGMTWSLAAAIGPSARVYLAMAYDPDCHRVVLFGGGLSAQELFGDTWEWDGMSWSALGVAGPPARALHALGHHSSSGQTVLFGGFAGGGAVGQGPLGDTWLLRPDQEPPRVVSVDADCDDNKVTVVFSEPVDPMDALNPVHYQIFCDGVAIQVTQVVGTDDPATYCLFTEQSFTLGRTCVIVIGNIRDLCGNRLSQFTQEFTCYPRSCYRTCKGKDFWLTFPGNYAPDPANLPRLTFCISGPPGTTGKVEVPGLAWVRNFTIPAAMSLTLTVTNGAELRDANDVIEEKGIHVTASREVSVVGFNHVRYTTDAYLALPSDTLGREYFVMGYSNVHTGAPDLNGTQFALVACEDNTEVTITVPVDTGIRTAGVPYVITLNRGQTYQLRNTNDFPADLSGTLIQSDKPVAVFGSHQCANVPDENVWFCDYLVEQLLPVPRAGTEFVTLPLATRNGDTFRFLAVEDSTTVSVNGGAVAVLNRGQMYGDVYYGPAHITADKPILVTQYANSADFDPPPGSFTQGDPFMVVIPHTGQYVTSYMICAPTNDFPDNYINVVIPEGATNTLTVDGAAPAVSFTVIGTSGYAGAQIPISPGPHVVTAGAPFSLIVYGWAEYDSYGYPGCLFLGDAQPPTVTCQVSNVTIQIQPGTFASCVAPVPDLRGEVQVSDNCPLPPQSTPVLQNPPPGTPVGPGIHTVTLCVRDAAGNVGCCQITLTVIDPSPVTINCPESINVACRTPQETEVRFNVTARTTCDTNVPVVCMPPSGSLFPEGTTTVNCQATSLAGQTASCSFPVTVTCQRVTISLMTFGSGLTVTTGVTVRWTVTGVLEHAPAVTGPWRPLTGPTNRYDGPLNAQQEFFRVRF